MWLLNTTTLTLRSFVENIPSYVILSHTWGKEEVGFDDTDKPYTLRMAGYDRIVGCCQLAISDGFEWIWIDTCCIDKRSSAELSEAINSMYKYYWSAAICYAYLSDVPVGSPWEPNMEPRKHFIKSRWFRREWTLQELLAPIVVEFYMSTGFFLGPNPNWLHTYGKPQGSRPNFC